MMGTSLPRAVLALALTVAVVGAADAAQRKKPADPSIWEPTRRAPLTEVKGDPVRGRVIVIKKGSCLTCHVMPIPEEADHGDIGPPLATVGSRYTPAELRMRVVDPKVLNPDTIMPSFYKSTLNRVAKGLEGTTFLEAQEVEDVVAYLSTLK
ncbi:sulfur oxidation c-type cytochrome SoxX [Paramagnetospirillum kuznetsovii]|uniref:Sulfur oxidation c-type cytochrome SoxX n=1 Tax=Paramagnetospirillum kuznetsovii TaxID=2053833 RepID=A0A364NVC7_9PROT|nr:sulfur oxidation c-type cytochrome SoxX [Paramagnetospirillum kuznetsovii]RAU20857.1 sulfur oxidation c-type cytochrome SoxX [Paramagnetospirillum kuznetsovii]